MHEVQLRGALPTRHIRPESIEEALAALEEHGDGARPIAGGTDLILEFERRMHETATVLVDLTGIGGLDAVTIDGDWAELGALVTHNQVLTSETLRARALPLVQACREIGSAQLRNRATVVGNLVTASPANDTISALRVLDAELTVRSVSGERTVRLADFHTGVRQTTLAVGELVTAVRFRLLGNGQRGIYVKAGNRVAQAISVVHAALTLDIDSEPAAVRVALGSVAPTIVEFRSDGPFDADAIRDLAAEIEQSLTPIDDVRATADYRRHAVRIIVERGLAALVDGDTSAIELGPLLSDFGTAARPSPSVDLRADDPIESVVNGTAVAATGVGATLLDWLRDHAGPATNSSLTGTKEGCAEGECGACTVRLNGAAVMSCLVPAATAHGQTIQTVEGIAANGLDPVQRAFVEHGAVQCGYCIPGFIVAARALLDEVSRPSRDEVIEALGGNLCRCTGYYPIVDAIVAAGSDA